MFIKMGKINISFLSNFESTVLKYGLSGYEKFIYLQGRLSEEPLMLIRSLEVGSQSYIAAEDFFMKTFASVVTQQ